MTDMATFAGTLQKVVTSIAKNFRPTRRRVTVHRQYSAFKTDVSSMCPLLGDPTNTMRSQCPVSAAATDRAEHATVPKRLLLACTVDEPRTIVANTTSG